VSFKIVIPSRNRANWLRRYPTRSTLKWVYEHEPTFIVNADDPQLEAYRDLTSEFGADLRVLGPSDPRGIAGVYDQAIEHAVTEEVERLLILDDDLAFRTRFSTVEVEYPRCQGNQLSDLLECWTSLLGPQVPAAALTPIQRRSVDPAALVLWSQPLVWAYAFYIPHFRLHPEHRFYQHPDIVAGCDYNLALSLLTSGYQVVMFNQLMTATAGENPGGCTSYRDYAAWDATVRYLEGRYPGIVSRNTASKRPIPRFIARTSRAFNLEKFEGLHGDYQKFGTRLLDQLELKFREVKR